MATRTALTSTIVELYESGGLSPEQISEDQKIEKTLVVATLLSFSPKFRNDSKGLGEEEMELVSKDELKGFLSEYKGIARYAEDESLRARCLENLINVGLKVTEGLGKNDPKKLLKDIGKSGNVYNLNMIIQRARKANVESQNKVNELLGLPIEAEVVA